MYYIGYLYMMSQLHSLFLFTDERMIMNRFYSRTNCDTDSLPQDIIKL